MDGAASLPPPAAAAPAAVASPPPARGRTASAAASPQQAAQASAPQAQPTAALRSTWECKLPVRVWVAPNSISSPTPLPPFYVLVPRQGYLSSISAQLWSQVQHVLPKLPGMSQPRPWFDHGGVPLRSSLPVGVLFDLLSPLDGGGGGGGSEQDASSLPWQLVLHYTHAPGETSVSWLASLPPHTVFMNSLKEACYICKGSEGSAAVMRMTGASQDALWSAVDRCDVVQYATCLAALKVTPSARAQGTVLPSIPVRLVLRQPPQEQQQQGDGAVASAGGAAAQPRQQQQGAAAVWSSVVNTSRPVPAMSAQGAWVTLGDMLHAMLPSLFPVPAPSTSSAPAPPETVSPAPQQPSQQQQPEGDGTTGPGAEGGATGAAAAAPQAADGATQQLPLGEGSPGRPQPHGDEASQGPQAGGNTGDGPLAAGSMLLSPPGTSSVVLQPPSAAPGAVQPQLTLPMLLPGPAGGGSGQPPVAAAEGADAATAESAARCEWRVCGVRPPLDTPLAWLHANMHAPDYFLYVVVRADVRRVGW